MKTNRAPAVVFLYGIRWRCLVGIGLFDILKNWTDFKGNRHIFEPGTYDVTSPNACTSYAALPFPSKLMEYRRRDAGDIVKAAHLLQWLWL